jgi:hypothetical protein
MSNNRRRTSRSHHNEWASFGKRDFEPVVSAFCELLDYFRCNRHRSRLYVTPEGFPEIQLYFKK